MTTFSGMQQMVDPVIYLTRNQIVPRRPFTAPSLYQRDIATMTSMLEDLRNIRAAADDGVTPITPYSKIVWRTHGYKRRVIICRPDRMKSNKDLRAVGFFGERRTGVDANVLERANAKLTKEFEDYPGLISYSSFELPGHRWANLVLFEDADFPEHWRASVRHAQAVDELAPIHYRNVRIHNCRVPGGIPGGNWIIIHRTKYWDYRSKRVWHAVRELPSPIIA